MLAKRLKERRELIGLTQTELGQRVGRTKQQIYRYEQGENEPDATTLALLSKELGASADYLLGLTDDPQGHLSEAELPPDEQEALLAYRAYKAGNSQRIMGVLAKVAPNSP
ncbi:MAG: helix-turn-helix transcriptional regulator [Anaerolineae bacterium]|nr:helix-turn-helix transcriptional regulator [Anaerolineae bacterium]